MAGAGKSTLRDLFKCDGALVINLDEVGHGFYSDPRSGVYKSVVETFADRVPGLVESDLSINRKKLGELVFSDKAALDELNSIFYGEFYGYVKNLAREMEKETAVRKGKGPGPGSASDLFVLDASVLFAAGLDSLMDYTVWVHASETALIRRLVKGRNIEEKYAASIVETQSKTYEGCRERADFIADNDGGPDGLKSEYIRIIKEIRNNVKKS
jgi:dephospho-CoA kinase